MEQYVGVGLIPVALANARPQFAQGSRLLTLLGRFRLRDTTLPRLLLPNANPSQLAQLIMNVKLGAISELTPHVPRSKTMPQLLMGSVRILRLLTGPQEGLVEASRVSVTTTEVALILQTPI